MLHLLFKRSKKHAPVQPERLPSLLRLGGIPAMNRAAILLLAFFHQHHCSEICPGGVGRRLLAARRECRACPVRYQKASEAQSRALFYCTAFKPARLGAKVTYGT